MPLQKIDQDRLDKVLLVLKEQEIRFPVAEIVRRTSFNKSNVSSYLKGVKPMSDNFYNTFITKFEPIVKKDINEKKGHTSNQLTAVHYDAFMEAYYVPRSAQAGYLRGNSDPTFIETLPTMLVPKEFDKGNYLVFEVSGNSMDDGTQRALMDGDKILAKELDRVHWKNKLFFKRNIFVIAEKEEGVVVKQIIAHDVEKGVVTKTNCL